VRRNKWRITENFSQYVATSTDVHSRARLDHHRALWRFVCFVSGRACVREFSKSSIANA